LPYGERHRCAETLRARVRGVHRQPGDLQPHGQQAADALVIGGHPASCRSVPRSSTTTWPWTSGAGTPRASPTRGPVESRGIRARRGEDLGFTCW